MSHSDFLFSLDSLHAQPAEPEPKSAFQQPWKVLIIDDDESIHQITTLVLRGFSFENRPIALLHAYSAREAFQMLEQQTDIAVAIVDVVMETNHAGEPVNLEKRLKKV
jgi:CheY-like chemotaxis protein